MGEGSFEEAVKESRFVLEKKKHLIPTLFTR